MNDKNLEFVWDKINTNLINLFKENIEDKDGSSWVHFAVWHNNEYLFELL